MPFHPVTPARSIGSVPAIQARPAVAAIPPRAEGELHTVVAQGWRHGPRRDGKAGLAVDHSAIGMIATMVLIWIWPSDSIAASSASRVAPAEDCSGRNPAFDDVLDPTIVLLEMLGTLNIPPTRAACSPRSSLRASACQAEQRWMGDCA